jgi:hypothetical protein
MKELGCFIVEGSLVGGCVLEDETSLGAAEAMDQCYRP